PKQKSGWKPPSHRGESRHVSGAVANVAATPASCAARTAQGSSSNSSLWPKGKEILGALDRLFEPPQQFLQILITLYEINIRRIYHQQIRRRVVKKEML